MNTPDARLKRRLGSMTPVPPAADLWPRLELAHRRRDRRLKLSVGSAAALLLCVALVPLLGDMVDRPGRAPLAAAAPEPAVAPLQVLDQDTVERIRALDRALQAAYDEGASDDELEPIWKARRALLPRQASISTPSTTSANKS